MKTIAISLLLLLAVGCSHEDQVVVIDDKFAICQDLTKLDHKWNITTIVWDSPYLGMGKIIYYRTGNVKGDVKEEVQKELEEAKNAIKEWNNMFLATD